MSFRFLFSNTWVIWLQVQKQLTVALAANTGIALTKTIAAVITASTSMTAEAIHSFADCGNQILLLIGMKKAQAPASALHPLGYGKVVIFPAIYCGRAAAFLVGGAFQPMKDIHKLAAPQQLQYPGKSPFWR